MKRYFLLIGCLMVLLPFVALAAGGQGKQAAVEQVTELSFGTTIIDARYPYSSNLPVFQEIEKKTGIKITWDELPQDQYDVSMKTRMAAGAENLPDIIRLPSGDPVKWGTEGIIIPLEDLIDKQAPNIVKLFKEYPGVRPITTAPDGHIYALSSIIQGSTFGNPFAIQIRKDWLEKVGRPAPETIDDWYSVLKDFQTKDPNGNGKQDEIPFHGYRLSWLGRWGEAWGLRLFVYSQGFSVGANNKLRYDYLDPKAKEVYTWLRKLYAEGLLDPDLTVTGDISVARRTTDITGAFFDFATKCIQWTKNINEAGFPNAHYSPTLPPKGPYGDRMAETGGIISGYYAITKACKDPAAAIKWLDFTYGSPEGIEYFMYGIEGKSFTRQGGKNQYTDFVLNNPDGMGTYEALRSLGAWPNVPYVQTQEAQDLLNESFPEILDFTVKCRPFIVTGFPSVLSTTQESEQFPLIMTDLDTYRDEFLSKFIMGTVSLEEWNTFTSTLGKMGIDEALKIKQGQWDRYVKAQK